MAHRILTFILGLLALLVLAALTMLMTFPLQSCSNRPVQAVKAPDGGQVAVLFQRDCGATTGFSTQISILKHGERLSGGGNVYVADADHGAAAAAPWGGPWAGLRWDAADHLVISHDPKSRVFRHETRRDGVRISYAAMPGAAGR